MDSVGSVRCSQWVLSSAFSKFCSFQSVSCVLCIQWVLFSIYTGINPVESKTSFHIPGVGCQQIIPISLGLRSVITTVGDGFSSWKNFWLFWKRNTSTTMHRCQRTVKITTLVNLVNIPIQHNIKIIPHIYR